MTAMIIAIIRRYSEFPCVYKSASMHAEGKDPAAAPWTTSLDPPELVFKELDMLLREHKNIKICTFLTCTHRHASVHECGAVKDAISNAFHIHMKNKKILSMYGIGFYCSKHFTYITMLSSNNFAR